MSIASLNLLRVKSRKVRVYRMYPTEEQSVRSGPWVAAVRFDFNLALDHRRTFGRKGRSITDNVQAKDLTALRAEIDWIRDASVGPLHQGLRDLHRAYGDWWKGPASAPTRRTRVVNDTMRFPHLFAFALRRLSRQAGEMALHQRLANVCKDFQHKLSNEVTKNHGVIVTKRLEIRNMAKSAAGTTEKPGKSVRAKSGLNRSIQDQGRGAFRDMPDWKLAEHGGHLVLETPGLPAGSAPIAAQSMLEATRNRGSCALAAAATPRTRIRMRRETYYGAGTPCSYLGGRLSACEARTILDIVA